MSARRTAVHLSAAMVAIALAALPVTAFILDQWWEDDATIVVDDIFLPTAAWAPDFEAQLAKWNDVRTVFNDHPFLINANPEFSFGADDGDNTAGFLDGPSLMAEYGKSYTSALAWTVKFYHDGGYAFEADTMLDPTLPWALFPNNTAWFQPVVLHELGHAQAMGGNPHETSRLTIMMLTSSIQLLGGDQLYADDYAGIDSVYSILQEVDVTALNTWHNGTQPKWMTMSATSLREGQTVTFGNFTVQNRGALPAPNPTFDVVLSDTPDMSPPLTVIDTWSQSALNPQSSATMVRQSTIPSLADCAQKYAGLLLPSAPSWNERFEQNNLVAFRNNSPSPAPLTLSLARDSREPNDSFSFAQVLPPAPYNADLSIDQDGDEDYFTVSLGQTRWVFLTVTYAYALGDIEIALYTQGGALIASSTTGIGFNEIRQRLDPGAYVVKVYGSGPGSCNHYNFNYIQFDCLYEWECDPTSTTFCQSKTCSNFTCVPVVPRPCDDGDACTRDICVQDHGGYCLFAPDPVLDPDGDGVCAALDCAPADAQAWAAPAEASSLAFGADGQTLRWDPLAAQAGPGVTYDLLRGRRPAAASPPGAADHCVPGIAGAMAVDDSQPAPGELFWYEVRGQNVCGSGSFGTGSDGAERQVTPCE